MARDPSGDRGTVEGRGTVSVEGTVSVRDAGPADAASIARICLATGPFEPASGAAAPYLDHLWATGQVMVAVWGRHVVGWGAVRQTPLDGGAAASMLTDLFVHPQAQGRGVGRTLLGALWPADTRARPRFTFSSRHPLALPLYARTGLQPRWPLLYLSAPRPAPLPDDLTVRRVSGAEAATVEATLTGANRARDHAYWAGQLDGQGRVVERAGSPIGVAAAGPASLHHLVTGPAEDAAAPFAVLAALDAPVVSLCLPGPHPALPGLLAAGFRIDDYDLMMATPDLDLPTSRVYHPGLA